MKDYENQLYFLNKINQDIDKSDDIPKEVFQNLKGIFSFILDLYNIDNINHEELGIVSLIIILSHSFYYAKRGIIKNKIIYLYEKLKSINIFQNEEFWKKYLEYIIIEEINKQNKNNELNEKQIQKYKRNFAFSPMLNIILYMKNFGIKKNKIRNIINDSFEKYNISKENKDSVNSYIEEQMIK